MDCIKKYTDQGFHIFPCSLSKIPITKHGFYNATNDYELLRKQFYKKDLLVGLPTGIKNGIVIIDFDINKPLEDENGHKILDESGSEIIDSRSVEELIDEIKEYGEFPTDTFQVQTQNGGRHFYFLAPNTQVSSKRRFLSKTLPIDIKSNGGYAITVSENDYYIVYDDVDDLGIENIKSRCLPLPEWIEFFQKKSETIIEGIILPPEEIQEIRSALSYISSDDRDTWVRTGMALKSTGSVSAYGLWNEWSKTSSKYKADDMEKRWAGLKPADITIGSLFHEAKRYGWMTTYSKKEIQVIPPQTDTPQEYNPNLPTDAEIEKIQISYKKQAFPDDLLHPTGLVGEIMQHILDRAIIPQPVFALSAALCAVGTLAGRKYQSPSGIRTNIYCLNVGDSGSGKDAPKKIIKKLFEDAGVSRRACVEDTASDSAIITVMVMTPSQLFLLDEIGRLLETTKKGGVHLYNVVSVLLKLYSSADEIYYGKVYAATDRDNQVKINQPNLCILGSTSPDTLYKGLNYEAASDGFLSRMMIFETDNSLMRKERRKALLKKTDKGLIDKIKALEARPINVKPEGNLDAVDNPNPKIVEIDENSQTMLDEFDDFIFNLRTQLKQDNRNDIIYNRTEQLAQQIAMIIAIGNNIDDPVITTDEMSYGIGLAKYLADEMHFIVENYMAKNDLEHEVKRILTIIRNSGYLSLPEIVKKTQNLPGYMRNDVLITLQESGQIEERLVGQGAFAHKVLVAK
jgi:hypothetical protein